MNETMRRFLPFASAWAFVASAQAAEPTVHLLNMGQPPQARVQTSAATDVVRSLALVLQTRVSMKVGAMAVPATDVPTVVLNLAWRSSGDATELTIEAVDVRVERGASTAVAAEVRAAVTALVGKVVRAGSSPVAADASPVVAQTLADLRGVLTHLLVPLPLEPVGVGGQWEAIRTVKRRGIEMVERAVYELLERDGQTVRVKLALDVGANPQKLVDPLAADARVTQLEGVGAGEIVVRLDQPGPVEGTLELSTIVKFRDRKRPLVLKTETVVELSSL